MSMDWVNLVKKDRNISLQDESDIDLLGLLENFDLRVQNLYRCQSK
jgi:hypothetical protein